MDFELYRRITANDVGAAVVVMVDDNQLTEGELTGFKPGALHTMALVTVGGQSYPVHPYVVRLKPLRILEDRPVYVGDIVVGDWGEGPYVFQIDAPYTPSPHELVYVKPAPGAPHDRKGTLAWRLLSWRAKETPIMGGEMYLNVYRSLPHGNKLIPGTVVFPSKKQAQEKATQSTLVGTYKLVEA